MSPGVSGLATAGHSAARCSVPSAPRWEAYSCVYVPAFLPEKRFHDLLAQYQCLKSELKEEHRSLAPGRLMALAGRAASALFGARWLRQRLRRRCGLRRLPSFFSEVPVEVREYRQNCGMLWHQDEVLTDPPDEPQLELVYTLENTSDSKTCWATSHLHVLREEIEEVWTAPNSILLLQAKGAVHMVRELTEGHRVIFKSCYRP